MNCGALTRPANGRVSYTAATYGHRAFYSCNTGYNRVGSSTRRCQATRRWSGSAPTCSRTLLASYCIQICQWMRYAYDEFLSTAVDCGILTNPANGSVSHNSGTTFRQTATYSCNTGYILVGSSTRTCQATRRWSGSPPTCPRMLLKLVSMYRNYSDTTYVN